MNTVKKKLPLVELWCTLPLILPILVAKEIAEFK